MTLYKAPTVPFAQIPRKIHMVWVGNEKKRPDHWIETWKDKHPGWEFKVWGNADLEARRWRGQKQMEIFRAADMWNGIADIMRYEILYEHGGFYIDADSMCVRPLDDWLLDTRLVAVWESEKHRPGLIACGFVGCLPKHPALRAMVEATEQMHEPIWRRDWSKMYWTGLRPRFEYKSVMPWVSVGPVFFTRMVLPFCPMDATILPSVMCLPKHHLDTEERKSSLIYARHEWGTTHKLYTEGEAAPVEVAA